jgi:hypothetical protein
MKHDLMTHLTRQWKAEQDAAPPKRPVPPTPDFAKPGTTGESYFSQLTTDDRAEG